MLFSLIELLIVITIITILLTMLLPMLNNVKKSAQAINCKENMKQMGTAISMYRNDYDGLFPPALACSGAYPYAWHGFLMTYMRSDDFIWDIDNYHIFKCPAQITDYKFNLKIKYGYNYYIASHLNGTPIFTRRNVVSPCKTVTVIDTDDDIEYSYIQIALRWDLMMTTSDSSIISQRHMKKTNMLFVDGHTDQDTRTKIVGDDNLRRDYYDPTR